MKKQKQQNKKLKNKLSKCIGDKHIAKARIKFAKHFLKNKMVTSTLSSWMNMSTSLVFANLKVR